MRPEEKDPAYLWDMKEAIQSIQEFTKDLGYAEYESDRKAQMAVERGLEILGEAARLLSDAFKTKHPEIPWRSIIAQRNVIAHEYGEIKQERIWQLLKGPLPILLSQIQAVLPKQ